MQIGGEDIEILIVNIALDFFLKKHYEKTPFCAFLLRNGLNRFWVRIW
jgi:hypothetical protein